MFGAWRLTSLVCWGRLAFRQPASAREVLRASRAARTPSNDSQFHQTAAFVAWRRLKMQLLRRFGDVETVNRLIFSAISSALLMASGPGQALAQDAAPAAIPPAAVQAPAAAAPMTPAAITPAVTPAAPAAVKTPAAKVKAVAAKPKPADAASAQEKLPWAATNAAPTATGNKAAEAPLKMACPGLYEAACREAQGCSWIADIKLESGVEVKARCVDRNPAAAKTASTKKATDKAAPAVAKKTPAGAAAKPDAATAKPDMATAKPDAAPMTKTEPIANPAAKTAVGPTAPLAPAKAAVPASAAPPAP